MCCGTVPCIVLLGIFSINRIISGVIVYFHTVIYPYWIHLIILISRFTWAGLRVLLSLDGFSCFIWYFPTPFPISYLADMLVALKIEECLIFALFISSNFVFSQLHIAFCIFASVAPPIVFRGKSLTYVYDFLIVFKPLMIFLAFVFPQEREIAVFIYNVEMMIDGVTIILISFDLRRFWSSLRIANAC